MKNTKKAIYDRKYYWEHVEERRKMKKIKIKAYPTTVGKQTKEQYYSILLNRAGIDAINNFFDVRELVLKKLKGGE